LDIAQTETKGTVLIHNANEMLDFTKGEEKHMESMLKSIADAGVKVVVTGNGVGELALHYLNRFGILVVKVMSKFDLRRLCRVTGATALARVGTPMAEELGYCEVVESVEIGGDRVTVFRQEEEATKTATIVIRGATQNYLDDVERALDDGINVIKAIVKDPRLVPGAGASEMELLKRLLIVGEVRMMGSDGFDDAGSLDAFKINFLLCVYNVCVLENTWIEPAFDQEVC
jgi:T-complex protein 1 subunit theta